MNRTDRLVAMVMHLQGEEAGARGGHGGAFRAMLDEQFPARADFSLARHLKECEARATMLPVRVWFADAAQERARRESYATLVPEQTRDGGAEFSFTTWSLEWLARWLLSFGGDAEALEPAALRELVCDGVEKIARRHAAATLLT